MATTSRKCGARHSLPPRCWRSLSALRRARQRTNPPMPRCRRSRPRFWRRGSRRPGKASVPDRSRLHSTRRGRQTPSTWTRHNSPTAACSSFPAAFSGRATAAAGASNSMPWRRPRAAPAAPDRWSSGFDGSRHYVYQSRGNGHFRRIRKPGSGSTAARAVLAPEQEPARNPRHGGDQDRPEDRRRDTLAYGRVGRGPVAYQVSDPCPARGISPSV